MSHTSQRLKGAREARMTRSQKRNDRTNMYSSTQQNSLVFKEFSEKELEQAKTNIRIKVKKEKRLLLFKVLIVSAILLLIISYYFPFWKLF